MGRRHSPFFLAERFLFLGSSFFSLLLFECIDSLPEEKKIILRREIITMSYKSLKDFGVSAERLGSMCKRWMARIQRFVYILFAIGVYNFVFLTTLVLYMPDSHQFCFVCLILGPYGSQSPLVLVPVVSLYLVWGAMLDFYFSTWDDCSLGLIHLSSAHTNVRKCLCALVVCEIETEERQL